MPTYQYQCTECGEALEIHQSFSDDALTVCPNCEGRLRKVFNAVGVVFKGSGFYRNDSRGTDPKGASATTSDTGSKDSAATTTAPKDSKSSSPKSDSSSGTTSSSSSSSSPSAPTT
ncbi:FmdB family zinc ribbon protein [Aeromicrobium sp. CF3.5]|uniref:FmdB family zinc ribbon protein n=1 Tax=Aeromicrobium sp. CF3.5 TaxID=3373078 RepID=UPI003EE5EB63